jgi:hypothetical protein
VSGDRKGDRAYEIVPGNTAILFFEQLARDVMAGKRDFQAELLGDLLRAYLELLGKVRGLEAGKSRIQEAVETVDYLIAMRWGTEAMDGPVSEKRIREIQTQARHDVSTASGVAYETLRREHHKRSGGRGRANQWRHLVRVGR